MSPPFRVPLVAIAMIAALGSTPASTHTPIRIPTIHTTRPIQSTERHPELIHRVLLNWRSATLLNASSASAERLPRWR